MFATTKVRLRLTVTQTSSATQYLLLIQ